MSRNSLKGFSLVELVVVLVVIALIIVAVIVGRGMMRTSALQSMVSDINKLTSAVRVFETNYQGLPGDIKAKDIFGDDIVGGNGDGVVEGDFEATLAAHHLSLAKLIVGDFSGKWSLNEGFIIGDNTIPSSLAASGAMRFICCGNTEYERDIIMGHHINVFAISTDNQSERQGIVSPKEARAIDQKIDDGNPDSGKIAAQGPFTGVGYSHEGCYRDRGFEDKGTYLSNHETLANRTEMCQLMFAYDH